MVAPIYTRLPGKRMFKQPLMHLLKSFTALVFILVFTLGFTVLSDWYLFETDNFSIEFPQKPVEKTQSLPTTIGDLKIVMWSAESKKGEDDNLVYSLMLSDYPDSLINSDKVELLDRFFRGSVDGAVNNIKGKLLSEKNIELSGFPGREARIEYANGKSIIKMKLYLVHNRMYILQTITEPGKEDNPNSFRFHDSFKIKS